VLRVLEFIAPPDYGNDLTGAIASYGVNGGCAFVDLFGISERFVSGFIAGGGFNLVEETEIRLPHLLQPWEPCTEPPGILFFGKRHPGSRYGLGPADDTSNIYISKGDGNMDWPSWIPGDDDNIIAPPTRMASEPKSQEPPKRNG
jgi:hypothetical protein